MGTRTHKHTEAHSTLVPQYGIAVSVGFQVQSDASTVHGNLGDTEWRGVDLATGEVIFHSAVYPNATNNQGEFLAIVHALAWLYEKERPREPVYSDSQTARAWVRNGEAQTQHTPSAEVLGLLARAEKWLREHPQHNAVRIWNTRAWGETPADYHRKPAGFQLQKQSQS